MRRTSVGHDGNADTLRKAIGPRFPAARSTPNKIIGQFRRLDLAWQLTLVAFGAALLEVLLAYLLGVGWRFACYDELLPGYFYEPNWGVLYLFGFPSAVFVCTQLTRWTRYSVDALNKIVKPVAMAGCAESGIEFSCAFDTRYTAKKREVWQSIGVVVAIGLAFGLGRDAILSPLTQYKTAADFNLADWSTANAFACQAHSTPYLLLNVIAYSLQAALIYCGLTVLWVSAVFAWEILSISAPPSAEGKKKNWGHKYKIEWDYEDATGRFGLHDCDRAFFFYLVALVLAFTFVQLTDYQKVQQGGLDIGGWLLTGSAFLLLPALLYLLIPFWSSFPTKLTPEMIAQGVVQPESWPFGEKLISFFLLSAIGALIAKVFLQIATAHKKM